MVLKMTGLSSRFQHKNRFWKVCTGSWDIKQNVPKIGSPNQTCKFWDVLANISGPGGYFSKQIFAFEPWAQAGRFEYHQSYNWNNLFLRYKGSCRFWKSRTPRLKSPKIENDFDFPKTYMIYQNNYYQPIWKRDFFNFQPTLIIILNTPVHPLFNQMSPFDTLLNKSPISV